MTPLYRVSREDLTEIRRVQAESEAKPLEQRSYSDHWAPLHIPRALLTHIDSLEQEVREYREALEFYKSKDTWRDADSDRLNAEGGFYPYELHDCPIAKDKGEIAREVLAKHPKGEA